MESLQNLLNDNPALLIIGVLLLLFDSKGAGTGILALLTKLLGKDTNPPPKPDDGKQLDIFDLIKLLTRQNVLHEGLRIDKEIADIAQKSVAVGCSIKKPDSEDGENEG